MKSNESKSFLKQVKYSWLQNKWLKLKGKKRNATSAFSD